MKSSAPIQNRFTISARQAVAVAQEEAARHQQRDITPVHLVLGLLQVEGEARDILRKAGLTVERVRTVIEQSATPAESSLEPPLHLTPETRQVMEIALTEAQHHHNKWIRSGHLLLGILALDDTSIVKALALNPEHIREQVKHALQIPPEKVTAEAPVTKPPWWQFWK